MAFSLRPRLAVGALLSLALAASAVLSGCGSTTASGPNYHLVNSGFLTVASDTTYPPAEFQDPNNPSQFTGYDIDIANELAKRLNLKPKILKTDFTTIISVYTGPALGQQHGDIIISSLTINDARSKQVDFVPYFTAGESILVLKGNPENIHSIADMCGKKISVQNNTTEQQEIEDANGGNNGSGQAPICKSNPIKELHYTSQNDVLQQLVNGRADASYQDQPVTGYYVSLNPDKVEVGGVTVSPAPQGIAVRKDNPALKTAIQNALNAMRADGTYLNILKKWGQESGAYPPLS